MAFGTKAGEALWLDRKQTILVTVIRIIITATPQKARCWLYALAPLALSSATLAPVRFTRSVKPLLGITQ
jgi:hypothetical protein